MTCNLCYACLLTPFLLAKSSIAHRDWNTNYDISSIFCTTDKHLKMKNSSKGQSTEYFDVLPVEIFGGLNKAQETLCTPHFRSVLRNESLANPWFIAQLIEEDAYGLWRLYEAGEDERFPKRDLGKGVGTRQLNPPAVVHARLPIGRKTSIHHSVLESRTKNETFISVASNNSIINVTAVLTFSNMTTIVTTDYYYIHTHYMFLMERILFPLDSKKISVRNRNNMNLFRHRTEGGMADDGALQRKDAGLLLISALPDVTEDVLIHKSYRTQLENVTTKIETVTCLTTRTVMHHDEVHETIKTTTAVQWIPWHLPMPKNKTEVRDNDANDYHDASVAYHDVYGYNNGPLKQPMQQVSYRYSLKWVD